MNGNNVKIHSERKRQRSMPTGTKLGASICVGNHRQDSRFPTGFPYFKIKKRCSMTTADSWISDRYILNQSDDTFYYSPLGRWQIWDSTLKSTRWLNVRYSCKPYRHTRTRILCRQSYTQADAEQVQTILLHYRGKVNCMGTISTGSSTAVTVIFAACRIYMLNMHRIHVFERIFQRTFRVIVSYSCEHWSLLQ